MKYEMIDLAPAKPVFLRIEFISLGTALIVKLKISGLLMCK